MILRFFFYQNASTKEWVVGARRNKDGKLELLYSPKMCDAYLYTYCTEPDGITLSQFNRYWVEIKRTRPSVPRKKRVKSGARVISKIS